MSLSKQIQEEALRLGSLFFDLDIPEEDVGELARVLTGIAAEIIAWRNENISLKNQCCQCDANRTARNDVAVVSFVGYWEMITPPEPMFEIRFKADYQTSLCLSTLQKRGISLPAGYTYPTFEEWKRSRGGGA